MSAQAKIVRRTVSVIRRKDVEPAEWIIEWPLGEITIALSPEEALRDIKTWAGKLSKRLGKNVITMIDWYNVPPGFEEPR